MGTIEMPVWMDNGGAYAAGMDRSVLWMAAPVPGIMAPDANVGATGAEGVVAQKAGGAALSVDVSPFRAIVAESGPTNASWRNYLCKHSGTAVTNVPMPAAPVGGNPRYDALCVLVADSTITSGNNWTFDVVQGTAAASPVYPTVTGMRTVLAMILRPNAAATVTTANITNCANRLWYEGGTRMAYAKYNPGAFTSLTTGSTSLVPIVAGVPGTGWTVVFTAPPTGKVKVVTEFFASFFTGTATNPGADIYGMYSAVVDASNAAPPGSLRAVTHWNQGITSAARDTGTGVQPIHRHIESHITGLTPGNVYQWWPAWKCGAGGGVNTLQVSNSAGDAWVAVYADA